MKNYIIPPLETTNNVLISEYLEASLEAFSAQTGLAVTFFNSANELVYEYNVNQKFCTLFENYRRSETPCRQKVSSAGQFSSHLGEPYLFLCKAGFGNIAMPFFKQGEFVGYFVAGPFILGSLRNYTMSNILKLNEVNERDKAYIDLFLKTMPTFPPDDTNRLMLLFYNSVAAELIQTQDYETLKKHYHPKKAMPLTSTSYTATEPEEEAAYPSDLEKTLLKNILEGNGDEADRSLRGIMGQLSIHESGNLAEIKRHMLWLFATIVRAAMDKNKALSNTMDVDTDVSNRIEGADSAQALQDVCRELVASITSSMMASLYTGNSTIVRAALQYINENYTQRISLKDISDFLHVNSSYFSTLFKKEMGISFVEYLNKMKIAKASELLTLTNLSIIEVTLAVGFDDQNYFTRLFRKIMGMSPRQYRKTYSSDALPTKHT